MKDKYGDKLRLTHIRDAINNIFSFFEGLQEADFMSVKVVCSATMYEFIVIGEASKHISASIKEKYSDVPWNFAYLTRNKLVHEYPNIQLEILWKAVKKNLPDLKAQIERYSAKKNLIISYN